MKYTAIISALALQAAAFPFVVEEVGKSDSMHMHDVERRQTGIPSLAAARKISKARDNCGPVKCLTFSATEQFVSTTGQYAYASPAADEIRGPCPGLNAAANHGYLPRSGIASIVETITGLGAAYGLSAEANAFLAAYAIAVTGDPVTGVWSIGGPLPSSNNVLSNGDGISYSHNLYEGDSSIGRNDAYINSGDAHSLNTTRFATAISTGLDNNRYTLDKFAQHFAANAADSEANNPYYFAAPFSTTVVSPAAYNFVINLMSNRTAAIPGGYLDASMFKTFFAITGTYPNYKWQRGQERIPENWYRRPSDNQYDVKGIGGDLAINWAAYPSSFRLGGNTNGVNTYTGISLSDLTGGAYNAKYLLSGNGAGAACFFTNVILAGLPNFADKGAADVAAVLALVTKYIKPAAGADCPAIDKYQQTLFNQFPGYHYSPTGPATNY